MLKHTVFVALLTLGLAAPALAQTTPQTPSVTAHAKHAARVAPQGKRKNSASTSTAGRHQLKRQVRKLRREVGKLRHRGK